MFLQKASNISFHMKGNGYGRFIVLTKRTQSSLCLTFADCRLHLCLNSTLVSLNISQVSLNSTQVSMFMVSYR